MKSQILQQYSNVLHLYAVRENYIIETKRSEERKKRAVGKLLHASLTAELGQQKLNIRKQILWRS